VIPQEQCRYLRDQQRVARIATAAAVTHHQDASCAVADSECYKLLRAVAALASSSLSPVFSDAFSFLFFFVF